MNAGTVSKRARASGRRHVRGLLKFMGENPDRDGLLETPDRVIRAWEELTAGYGMDAGSILDKTFSEDSDELVIVKGIQFYSTCEHHLLTFSGTASIAYLPSGRVVGLSKLPRLVECFARRLQVQERMTNQIAAAIDTFLSPRGVGVVITGRHSCMGCRGVRQPAALMVTSSMLGMLRTSAACRAEFLALIA